MEPWLKKRFFNCSQPEKKQAKKEKIPLWVRNLKKNNVCEKDIEFLVLIDSIPEPTRAKLASRLNVSTAAVCIRIKKIEKSAKKNRNKPVKKTVSTKLLEIRKEKRGPKGKRKDSKRVPEENKKIREKRKQEREEKRRKGEEEKQIKKEERQKKKQKREEEKQKQEEERQEKRRIREEEKRRREEEKQGKKQRREEKRQRREEERQRKEEEKDKREEKQEGGVIEYCPICGGISCPDGENKRRCNNGHSWPSKNKKTRTVVTSRVEDQESHKRAEVGSDLPTGWSGETYQSVRRNKR